MVKTNSNIVQLKETLVPYLGGFYFLTDFNKSKLHVEILLAKTCYTAERTLLTFTPPF
jgi:hypothetical protein